ncbi:MAG: hypothetical protein COY40_06810 [Alphaproteobacteria bacterium CG_4_10_14_0_8_um_filter_53_9]|nr:MAG: hypothetical protein COY40_06810 [Alphaproteobacteria bacterium CG_4_10_14_0_8_um_filter_53_9]
MSENTAFPHLAPTLKKLLEAHNLTASELSRQSGISVATLSRMLSGQGNPTFENICRLAHIFSVPLSHFAPTTPDEKPTQSPSTGRDPLLAMFEVTSPDLTEKQVANLMLSAARGRSMPSWLGAYAAPDTPQIEVISSTPAGPQRFHVTMAFPSEHIEAGSLSSILSMLSAALTGTHAQVLDVTLPTSLLRTFNGPAFGVRGLRDTFNKHGRPLLMASLRPSTGLSPKMYARSAFECLLGGLDITADPAQLTHTPAMPWRERFRFLAEATLTAGQQTVEYKAHALNIMAGTVEEMQERALWAKDLDMATLLVDPSVIGWSATASMAKWARNNDMLLVATGSRPLFGLHLPEHLQAKFLRLIGADIVSTASPLRGNVSGRRLVTGTLAHLRDKEVPANPEEHHPLPQIYGGLTGSMPAPGGGHNPWHFPRLADAVGDDAILQVGASTISHPWGSAAGATAARTALEATIQARNEGHTLSVDNRTILQRAAKFSPELKESLRHFQEGSFQFGVIHGSGDKNTPTEGTVIPPKPSDNVTLFRRPEPTPENDTE